MGKNRLEWGHNNAYPCIHEPWMDRPNYIQIYIPNRTCMVLVAEENMGKYEMDKLFKF
jgi:hypothetical protein